MTKPPKRAGSLGESEERFRLLVESVRDYAIFMLDPDGRVLTWNAGAERIKGYRAGGDHRAALLACSIRRRRATAARRTSCESPRREGRFEDEGWRVRKDGSRFWANVVITALRDADGKLRRLRARSRATSPSGASTRRRSGTARSASGCWSRGCSDYAIFMLDVNGMRRRPGTPAPQRIKGYRAEEIIGQHFSIFYPERRRAKAAGRSTSCRSPRRRGASTTKAGACARTARRFWANVTITALRDDAGRLRGFAKLTRDLTERKRAEALEASGAERETILEAERNARMLAQRARASRTNSWRRCRTSCARR